MNLSSLRSTGRGAVALVVLLSSLALPRAAHAQPTLLQIHPRVGDTLTIRMDQEVEMTGVPADCISTVATGRQRNSARSRAQSCVESTRRMTTRMEIFSRAIVQRSLNDATLLRAHTDSVRTSTSSSPGNNSSPSRVTSPQSTIEFRVAADGAAEISSDDASNELRAIFGQMPAMLSRKPVSVGEKWVREMRLPSTAVRGANGIVRASFQFDSLGANGDIAFISMRGTLSRDQKDTASEGMSGTLSGAIQLDRRLAWITDTRARIDVQSTVRPPSGQPMIVKTRITQHLKAAKLR